ncbi:MAG: GIY-YIG nuclease family protein [Microgenomates group bacterium]
MFYVYVLRSKARNICYTGFTGNLQERLKYHLAHQVKSTKSMGDLELIFYEGYLSKSDAQRREKYLKTTKGKRALKLMLRDYFKSESVAIV